LGLLMPISVITSTGVLMIALADVAAREGKSSKEAFFWLGIVLIAGPAAARLCSHRPSRRERIWLVLLFGLGLYLAKVMYSPSRLVFSDEFVQLRAVQDILSSGHLFSFNPVLPEAASYPGLGNLTSGLVHLTGLPISTAAFLIIGSARLVLMLAIFLVIERLSNSQRIAGLACFLYAANPNFLYWSAQFDYESLALPLVAFTIYLVIRRSGIEGSRRLTVLAAASILAVVITHHLSSYFLAIVLAMWSAVVLWRRVRQGAGGEYAPFGLAFLATAAIGFWLTAVAPITGQYLGGIASSTGRGLFSVITGAGGTRQLFTSGSEVAPLWERLLSVASVGITLAALALVACLIWKRRRIAPLMMPLLILGLAYALLLPLRLVGSATETANRSTEFLYLGLGAVLAVGAFELRSRRHLGGVIITAGVAIASAIVLLGGIAVSWQYSERLPQDASARAVPYELSTEAISADRWAAANLGPGHRFASDFLDRLGLATYGLQRPLYAPADGVSAWQVLAPAHVDPSVRRAIRVGHVEYVMIERRLSEGIPSSGSYFDRGEPQAGKFKKPINPATLGKFDRTPGASRLYDNGKEQIYGVAALR